MQLNLQRLAGCPQPYVVKLVQTVLAFIKGPVGTGLQRHQDFDENPTHGAILACIHAVDDFHNRLPQERGKEIAGGQIQTTCRSDSALFGLVENSILTAVYAVRSQSFQTSKASPALFKSAHAGSLPLRLAQWALPCSKSRI